MRISDISVSRNHASLKLINNKFYLEDNLSKFGSLIQLNCDILFLPYKQISLQIGKSCLFFNLKKNFLAWIRCFNILNEEFIDYNDYFEKKHLDNKEIIIDCVIVNIIFII